MTERPTPSFGVAGDLLFIPYGDRRQEIVFIGMQMDRAAIEEHMNAALLTEDEMAGGPVGWRKFDDPFAEMFRDQEPVEA
jgi:Cobalamin synthesis protein cobW C-terminal domain